MPPTSAANASTSPGMLFPTWLFGAAADSTAGSQSWQTLAASLQTTARKRLRRSEVRGGSDASYVYRLISKNCKPAAEDQPFVLGGCENTRGRDAAFLVH